MTLIFQLSSSLLSLSINSAPNMIKQGISAGSWLLILYYWNLRYETDGQVYVRRPPYVYNMPHLKTSGLIHFGNCEQILVAERPACLAQSERRVYYLTIWQWGRRRSRKEGYGSIPYWWSETKLLRPEGQAVRESKVVPTTRADGYTTLFYFRNPALILGD